MYVCIYVCTYVNLQYLDLTWLSPERQKGPIKDFHSLKRIKSDIKGSQQGKSGLINLTE